MELTAMKKQQNDLARGMGKMKRQWDRWHLAYAVRIQEEKEGGEKKGLKRERRRGIKQGPV